MVWGVELCAGDSAELGSDMVGVQRGAKATPQPVAHG